MIRVSVFSGGKPDEVGATKIEELDSATALQDELIRRLMTETPIIREIGLSRILIEHPDESRLNQTQFILFESPNSDEEAFAPFVEVADWYNVAMEAIEQLKRRKGK